MADMTTKEAVEHVLKNNKVKSKYALAVHVLDIQPIMIDNYMKTTRMGKVTAERFELAFDIHITDAYDMRSIL